MMISCKETSVYSKGANMKANFFLKSLANIIDFAVIFRLVKINYE